MYIRYEGEPLSVALINTFDGMRPNPESLTEPRDLAAFMDAWGMDPGDLGVADLDRARGLRERLRRVFEASSEARARDQLNEILAESPIAMKLETSGGRWSVEYRPMASDPVGRLEAACATDLAAWVTARGLERLRTCAALPCRDVFVDVSRNASRRFCCLACANRHRVAAYRRRART